MTPFVLREVEGFGVESLERRVLMQESFAKGENRRVQVHSGYLFLKGLGCTDEQIYAVLANVTGIKRRGLMYHFEQHSKFLKLTEEEKKDHNKLHYGRPCSFNDQQLKSIRDYVSKERTQDRLVLFEDIEKFVFGVLGLEIGEATIRAAIKDAGLKLVPAKAQERSSREIDPQCIDHYFSELAVINGTPSNFVINIDESGQQD